MEWAMNSDAGLVTGEFFVDHQLVTYQSQGQEIGLDLQYSSGQAQVTPTVEYQFTTPLAGNSSDITSIDAELTVAGVSQGAATAYTSAGVTDGETYYIPLQVDATSLATGVYPYEMTLTEHFGSGSGSYMLQTIADGNVNVVNETSDPLGAGWSVGGLEHLLRRSAPGGPVLITSGQSGDRAIRSHLRQRTDLFARPSARG